MAGGRRPAVQRGVKVPADQRKPLRDDKARDILFGHMLDQQRSIPPLTAGKRK